jgi:hypothetical protein
VRSHGVWVGVAALLLGACAAGDRSDFGPPATPSTTTVVASTTTPAPAPTTTVAQPDAGTVTLRVTGLALPAAGAGGPGLRLLVRAASPRLVVRREGGAGAVTACPAATATGAADAAGCVDLAPRSAVTMAFVGGVEVRATGPAATVDELSVNYLPAARTTTILTPARPAGACAARACEATFSLVPGGPGAFSLDGRSAGGRPRLILTSVGPNSNRTLATVEGGGNLSIRATLEAGSEARLLHHEQSDGEIAPLTAEIVWP